MIPDPFNPYAPPAATEAGATPPAHHRRWAEVAARVAAVVVGFSLVADPLAFPGISTALGRALGGHVLARGIGLALLTAGFVPWRRQSPTRSGDPAGPAGEDL